MIVYKSGAFGFRVLFRLHGSAIIRALIPSGISTTFLMVVSNLFPKQSFGDPDERLIGHPYAIGALVAAFTFIITFRANFGYNRYWEAAGSVHHMHSKWMDAAMTMASFHYQAAQYDKIRPPSFGKHQELHHVIKERSRMQECTADELKEQLNELIKEQAPKPIFLQQNSIESTKQKEMSVASYVAKQNDVSCARLTEGVTYTEITKKSRLDHMSSVSALSIGSDSERNEPSLFLQEASHLMSLLSAVALSTLRDDVEGAEIPMVEYIPGTEFPPVDPDQLSPEIRAVYYERNKCWAIIRFLFGISRDQRQRTLYNAARPFRVLGGVSDAEALRLRKAKGPMAKVALCTMWLQEFIQREHMAGSTGAVAPPIISRLYQYVSDGMMGYNQARKVAYIPFPFPHFQMSVLFVGVIVFVMPVLMFSFVFDPVLAGILNFLTVLCFAGLDEVARELENPFQNAPNDLPLANFQAQFNEALVEMFAGFHPDAFWEVLKKHDVQLKRSIENSHVKRNEEKAIGDGVYRTSDYGSVQLSGHFDIDAGKES